MLLDGSDSSEVLKRLRQNLQDEALWTELVNLQGSVAAQIDVLERAIATIPSSLQLRKRLVEVQLSSGMISSKTEQSLIDTLSLYPDQYDLWDALIQYFPSTETFSFALRYVDNQRVWAEYYTYLLKNKELPLEEKLAGILHYLEFDASKLDDVLRDVLENNLQKIADHLLLKFKPMNIKIWDVVVKNCENLEVLRTARELFPEHDAEILPRLVEQLYQSGEFNSARRILLVEIEKCCSVKRFISIFALTCQLYEWHISRQMQTHGQGGWDTTKLLTEFGNLLRKRPLHLNETALREDSQCVNVWLDRARLWHTRPHIAADVLEKALEVLNPLLVKGSIDELYIEYARLLVSNGSHGDVRTVLEGAIGIHCLRANQKCNLYYSLAEILQPFDSQGAENVLETALKSNVFTESHLEKLWTIYLSILIENKSPKTLEAFSRACIDGAVTMRMCVMVAKSYPAGSNNQIAVFDKGVSIFPSHVSLPLWKQFLASVGTHASLDVLRGIYNRAFVTFQNHKREYEEICLLYFNVERSLANGSLVLARKKLVKVINTSVNPLVWKAYIFTLGDLSLQRQAYEQALNRLEASAIRGLALEFAALEEQQGENERARCIYEFVAQITNSVPADNTKDFRERHLGPEEIQFVPAMT